MLASKPLEDRKPVLIAGDGLAIDQAGTALSLLTASTGAGSAEPNRAHSLLGKL
jgi:hypothetical protein